MDLDLVATAGRAVDRPADVEVVRVGVEGDSQAPAAGGSACGCASTARVCRKTLEMEKHLWTFAEVEGVASDNNAVERALRHGVIWRELNLGTASGAGSRFVERLLSVVETCRQG